MRKICRNCSEINRKWVARPTPVKGVCRTQFTWVCEIAWLETGTDARFNPYPFVKNFEAPKACPYLCEHIVDKQ